MSRHFPVISSQALDPSASCTASKCFRGGWVSGGLGQQSPSMLFIGNTSMKLTQQNTIGLMTHEIFHSLGVEHTQRRPDRDEYITINHNALDCPYQYRSCPTCLTYSTPYDCMSIMHYRDYFCKKDGTTEKTMVATGKIPCNLNSANTVLTGSDKELLNRMYECRSGCCGSLTVSGKYFANGKYIRTDKLHNNKPVYKHTGGDSPYGGWCIFFGGHWKIDVCNFLTEGDWSRGYGWSKVDTECPGYIGSQWRYYSWRGGSGSGPIDTSIVVKCDEGCCNSLKVTGKYFANGEYKKTAEQHNGSPVYKYTGTGPYGGWCIFFGGHWKIDVCNFLTVGDWSRGYGWSNVNALCPGNIGPQWRYYSWSGGS